MNIKYIEHAAGNSLYINDYRVAGNKPWGGGRTIEEWDILDKEDLKSIKEDIEKELLEQKNDT